MKYSLDPNQTDYILMLVKSVGKATVDWEILVRGLFT